MFLQALIRLIGKLVLVNHLFSGVSTENKWAEQNDVIDRYVRVSCNLINSTFSMMQSDDTAVEKIHSLFGSKPLSYRRFTSRRQGCC